jgi:hypothetical protein
MPHSKVLFRSVVTLLVSVVTAFGSLIITPTFDSSITSDANSAAIEATINSTIDIYESAFLDPINVNITFKEMGTGLGQSNFSLYQVSYASLYGGLTADAKTADDHAAVARLSVDGSVTDPVTGSSIILIKSANAKALGFSGFSGSDGTISFNSLLTTPGAGGTSGAYPLAAVLEHEMDEILGLGSTLGTETTAPLSNQPSPEDFFRFRNDGTRIFNGAAPSDATQYSYFSIDGTTDLAQFNNTGSGDYGDWQSNPRPAGVAAQIQDAFGSPGSDPALGVELKALDVIGYDRNVVPEPASVFLFASGIGALVMFHRRLRLRT